MKTVKEIEYCSVCGEPTDRCGDDSIYEYNIRTKTENGPLCEDCHDKGIYLGLFGSEIWMESDRWNL